MSRTSPEGVSHDTTEAAMSWCTPTVKQATFPTPHFSKSVTQPLLDDYRQQYAFFTEREVTSRHISNVPSTTYVYKLTVHVLRLVHCTTPNYLLIQ